MTTPTALKQYFTPEWAAQALVERYFPDLDEQDTVIEPSCGRGAFLKAIPQGVTTVGVELDPSLAGEAAAATGRRVIVGDFRTVTLPFDPTVIVGNPPFNVELVKAFLRRAWAILPRDGRCGLLLPAYVMQTPTRVVRWAAQWSIEQEMIPRTLFPRLTCPLAFVMFRKSGIRTMVGFALYQEKVEIDNLTKAARLLLIESPRRLTCWRALVEEGLRQLGGRANLEALYQWIEPRRLTPNPWWREKIRQQVQTIARPLGRGVWELA